MCRVEKCLNCPYFIDSCEFCVMDNRYIDIDTMKKQEMRENYGIKVIEIYK